ncbi:uncharacterized protein MONOS_12029 [Monocercomonoides exilis]|uniref:uncharacterized protein n=1 Tax=Monocercomonoides exilis TaxID=2049356 RepID=UPI00355A56A9|nr:hypothetical protein MONOS_12029 [Monocercomonoides exilis]
MADIFRSERWGHDTPAHTPATVGPGSYTRELVSSNAKRAYVPFSVKSKRFEESASLTPGPGAYQTELEFEPTARRKLLSSFASTNDRFEPLRKKRDPGPGQYTTTLDWTKPSFRVQPNVSEQAKSEGIISPFTTSPSIPTKTQSYGYVDAPQGGLQMKQPPKEGHTGRGIDLPGPGEYAVDAIVHEMNFKRAGQFSIPKAARLRKDETEVPGPGSYSPVRPRERELQALPSTVFVSSTKRDFVKPTKVPGPGSYSISTSMAKSYPEERIQSFGSVAIREVCEPSHRSASEIERSVPGPGSYQLKGAFRPPPSAPCPFSSSSQRFSLDSPSEMGPGSYTPHLPSFKPATRTASAFGSLTRRFPSEGEERKKNGVPGPGTYDHFKAPVTEYRERHPQSVFSSATRRFQSELSDTPGPGSYAERVRAIKYDPQITLTGQIHPSAAFLGPSREVGRGDSSVPGPGSYLSTTSSPVKDNRQTGFLTLSPRFREKVPDNPGPGTYESSPPALAKRSFNRTITLPVRTY